MSAEKFIEKLNEVKREQESSRKAFIESLRYRGFKGAHPNDGWVNRRDMEVFLCYPHFDDGVKIGSKVMLGSPGGKDLRPIRIVGRRDSRLGPMTYWKFEDLES